MILTIQQKTSVKGSTLSLGEPTKIAQTITFIVDEPPNSV